MIQIYETDEGYKTEAALQREFIIGMELKQEYEIYLKMIVKKKIKVKQ